MCGVIGIIGPEQDRVRSVSCAVADEVYRGLLALQHRGQDAAGILSFDPETRMFALEKDLGLVAQVFDQKKIEKLKGYMAIGHARYATAGTDGARDVQPMVTGTPFGLGMAHNGNILNYHDLADELSAHFGRQLLTENDLEALTHYWSHYLMDGAALPSARTFSFDNIKKAAARLFDRVVGGYAAVALIAGQGLVAFRDPRGIRPLALGAKETAAGMQYCVASETVALLRLGYTYQRDIAPGEVLFITARGEMHSAVVRQETAVAPCMFEWVYFSGAESEMDHRSVYGVRLKLGARLAVKAQAAISAGEIAPDVVMPVPDTSRSAAISVADILKLPYREGLIKNRYVARSFILSTQEKREEAVEQKLTPVVSEIAGKSILLVDDSIVRGTTSKKLVELLMKCGAREVIFGVTCPPVRHACYYGIDFPDPATLLAHGRDVDGIARWMGARKVIYLDEEDLRLAIGASKLCMACLNGKYPTVTAAAGEFSGRREKIRSAGGAR